jgi:hypothetical protein
MMPTGTPFSDAPDHVRTFGYAVHFSALWLCQVIRIEYRWGT